MEVNHFHRANSADYVLPIAGSENVFSPDTTVYGYSFVWVAVQVLVNVRAYLDSNQAASIELFLSIVGRVDP